MFVFFGIWAPAVCHFYTPNVIIKDEIIEASRYLPADSEFDELKSFRYGLNRSFLNANHQVLIIAEKILEGKLEIPGLPSTAINRPFDADDLNRSIPGWPGWQLFVAGFGIPNFLLRGYQLTNRDDFLMEAMDIILEWASYEREAWLPKGLLWNDHAISARVLVLAEFWRFYRNCRHYDAAVAKAIFQLVAQYAYLLAKPSHFTFSTNHGITQNLALWHICLTFPTLPNLEHYKQVAFDRMRDQMPFYINDEGVVLEHSAGYQRWGIEFLSIAFRYLTLMDLTIPEVWKKKYKKAKDFYAQLRRPDRSKPMFGDTRPMGRGPLVTHVGSNGRSRRLDYKRHWSPNQPSSLYPVAGYSVWWDGLDEWPYEDKLNQTVVVWSYFPGHAHKHADEMSVLLWAKGQTWWTNIGYWPYGTKGRSEAVSWSGSNAPHLVNESTNSLRNTELKFHGTSDHLAFIDLERKGPGGYVARRQVTKVKPSLWVVIDHVSGSKNEKNTIMWTTSHNIQLIEGKDPGSYLLKTQKTDATLTKYVLGSEGTKISQFKGSFSPFAGWENKRPASAIVIEQPADNSWAVAIWSLQESNDPVWQFSRQPVMENWDDPEKWQILLPFTSTSMRLFREGGRVRLDEDVRGSCSQTQLMLSKPPNVENAQANIRTAFESAAKKYPKKKYSIARRMKVTYLLLFVFLIQEAFFLAYTRIGGKYLKGLRRLNSIGWIAVGILLVWVI